MTINDLTINEKCLRIRQLADSLSLSMRDGRELSLFVALSDIERAARDAQWRLNDLRHETDKSRV